MVVPRRHRVVNAFRSATVSLLRIAELRGQYLAKRAQNQTCEIPSIRTKLALKVNLVRYLGLQESEFLARIRFDPDCLPFLSSSRRYYNACVRLLAKRVTTLSRTQSCISFVSIVVLRKQLST